MKLTRTNFGTTQKGEIVELFTLSNDVMSVQITNYGAIITSIETLDSKGEKANVVCGFSHFEDYQSEAYLAGCPYFGCVAGRYANRIGKGKFKLDGETYTLPINNGPNSLHGGIVGFDKVVWTAKELATDEFVGVELSYTSVDGEEGYPGTLIVTTTYTLNAKNELEIVYCASTDKKTIVNLTNHSYFNLTGGKENIMNHVLDIDAETFTVTDADMTPTGEIVTLEGTPNDFRTAKKISSDIDQLETGYDLNFVFADHTGEMRKVACLTEETSGRYMDVETTQPGVQLYTGYWIPSLEGKGGEQFGSYSGVALETQHYADSPNNPSFPSTELVPGEKFCEKTIYRFGTK